MIQVVTAGQMKEADQLTIEKFGMPSLVLMERAAVETVREMEMHFQEHPEDAKRILVLCGSGNNGGDGVAIARILTLHGFSCEYTLVGNPDHFTRELTQQIHIADQYHVKKENVPELNQYTTIVDALLGVGLSREVKGSYRHLIELMEHSAAYKVAVDLPSGIDGTTGAVLGVSYHADLTVTYGYLKSGLCLYPGRSHAGRLVVADVGIYTVPGMSTAYALEDEDLLNYPKREDAGNKGSYGKVLVVGGSEGMAGAAYLAAYGALSAGAGMVKIQTVKENRIPIQTLLPEAILSAGEMEADYQASLDWCDALVIGPGLGTSVKAALKAGWFLWKAAETHKPVVLDADGLNLLAENPQWLAYINASTILTPHMGEMSRLTGNTISGLKKDPATAALSYAKATGACVVLKDACTVIAGSDGSLYYNRSGNAVLGTAGSGDVLSGVIGALQGFAAKGMCQKETEYNAALGVYLHGRAGDDRKKKIGAYGVKAGDIPAGIISVLNRDKGEDTI